MFFRRLITWLLLAIRISGSNLCDRIKSNPEGTKEEYKETIGPWFRGQIAEWKSLNETGEDSKHHLWKWLAHKYAPTMAQSEIGCETTDHCSLVNCNNVDEQFSEDDQYNFYRTAEAITNLHNARHQLDRQHQAMFTNTLAMKEDLVRTFSNSWAMRAQRAKREHVMKMAMHITLAATAVLATLLNFVPFVKGGAMKFQGIKTATEIGEAIAKFTAPTSGFKLLTSVIVPTIAGEELVAFNVVLDLMTPANAVEKTVADVSSMQGKNRIFAEKVFAGDMTNLMSGEISFGNVTIADYVENGGFAQPQEVSPGYIDFIKDLWLASWISNIWNAEMVYIVMADTHNCKSDDRGPPALKVCLEEHVSSVFYIYMHGRNKEGQVGTGHVKPPAGYNLLGKGEYARITLKDIVKSSIAQFKDFGNRIPEKISSQAFDTFYGDESSFFHEGGLYRGIFSVPVCYTPDGYAISAINVGGKHSRNYPCMCFPPTWDKHHHSHDSEMGGLYHHEKREAMGGKKIHATTGSAKATERFLKATGFYVSGDWQHFCKHKQNCHPDKSITWTGKFGKGQKKKINHPYKVCEHRGHKNHGKTKPPQLTGTAGINLDYQDAIWDFEAAELRCNTTGECVDEIDADFTDDDFTSDGENDSGDEAEGDHDQEGMNVSDAAGLQPSRDKRTGNASHFHA